MTPKFLASEVAPYTSIEIVPATVCGCGVPLKRHVDGWDGNRLGCAEARRRFGLPELKVEPEPRDDDDRDDRDDDQGGDACGRGCGYCGRCS